MNTSDACVFCDGATQQGRIIRADTLFTSFVSSPWFRFGHCLVIPNRHVITIDELHPQESVAIMEEVGRLAKKLDKGYGSGIMQKYQPLQAENGIKVSHLHFHVFPREEHEAGLFPVPQPNSFGAFRPAPQADIDKLLQQFH